MKVPTVGSVVRVSTRYSQGPRMFPPQADYTVFEGKVLTSDKWLTDREFCLSGDANWPIRVINMSNVIGITLVSGSFKNVDTEPKVFEVQGSKGSKYFVTREPSGWKCTCSGFQFRKQCKHVAAYKE